MTEEACARKLATVPEQTLRLLNCFIIRSTLSQDLIGSTGRHIEKIIAAPVAMFKCQLYLVVYLGQFEAKAKLGPVNLPSASFKVASEQLPISTEYCGEKYCCCRHVRICIKRVDKGPVTTTIM